MFSHEEREKAIQLFLKYDCSYAATIRELGYPSVGALRKWYKEYLSVGELHQDHRRKSKYSEKQKKLGVVADELEWTGSYWKVKNLPKLTEWIANNFRKKMINYKEH